MAVDVSHVIEETWSEILSRDIFSNDQSFFDVGGDSFLAMVAAGRLSERLRIDLAVTDIYAHPSVRQLSRYVEELLRSGRSQRD